MPQVACDDVIRIRVDTTWAVLDFIRQLALQAASGETRAPANPAQTAIFREIAPYRLVEYNYVDDRVGTVEAVYVGFPNGALFASGDDIPEAAVNDLILATVGDEPALPPVYIYVILSQPASEDRIRGYLQALANHLGQPLVGVFHNDGNVIAIAEDAAGPAAGRVKAAAIHAAGERYRHLSKSTLQLDLSDMCERPDGRAYARIGYAYAQHVLEFASREDRDAFLLWSRGLWGWIQSEQTSNAELGFPEFLRPAEPAHSPEDVLRTVRLRTPLPFAADAVGMARGYWAYVRTALKAAG
jgi:hypothetical protein